MTLRGKMILHHFFWEPTIYGRRVEDYRYGREKMENQDQIEGQEDWPDDTRWQS